MSAKSFFQKFHIGYMVAVVRGAAVRFPLTFLGALALTAIAVLEIHDAKIFEKDMLARSTVFLMQAVVLSLGVHLLGEGRRWLQGKTILVALPLLGLLALTAYLPDYFGAMQFFTAAAAVLFLLFAGFVGRYVSEDTVWLFNYQSAFAVVLGGIATLILCLGLCAILASIKYLFGVDISGKIYGDVWVIGGGLFFPVYVMASVPRDLNDQSPICAMPVGISFIANYLMVPMMLAYTAILYAYGVKIIVEWALPKGNLAYMVTGYGSIGVVTHLCIYPIRETGTRLLRFFYRAFYVLLTGPLALLAVGIWTRITDYGLTEQRVAIVLCLVWLAVLSLWHIVKRAETHIKHVPLVLMLMALVAAFSAEKLSVQSQFARLQTVMQTAGVLTEDGRIVKAAKEVDFDLRKNISSIIDYLRAREQLALLQSWIEPFRGSEYLKDIDEENFYGCKERLSSYCQHKAQTSDIMAAWGMDYVNRWETVDRYTQHHNVNLPYGHRDYGKIMSVAPYQYVVSISSYVRDKDQHTQKVYLQDEAKIPGVFSHLSVQLDKDMMLEVKTNTGRRAVFDLRALVAWAHEARPQTVSEADMRRMTLAPVSGDLAAEYRISSFTAGTGKTEKEADESGADDPWYMKSISGILLFSVAE